MTCEKQCDITPSSGHWRFPSSQAESLRFIQTHLDRSSLHGKKIGIIGDSYVRNHRDPIEYTWHYKFAQKYGMQYYNYGKNGNCIALDLKQWGTGMYKRYASMNDSLDYIVIIAGQDGNIRFLDLDDGTITRNSIKLGYPMNGTPSLHTVGQPYMAVGQFAR